MTTTRVLVILSLTTTPSFVLVSATSPISYEPARSRRMVFARARSRLACCTRDGFLATPMESWKRRLNSSSVSSRTFCSSSSPFMSRHADAFMDAGSLERAGTGHELGLDADLLGGEAETLARRRLVHAFHLVHDPARLHHGDPELGVTLALAHARLRRLLGHRLVREDTNENLPT